MDVATLAAKFERLAKAARDVYYAAYWEPDRDCDADALWKELRDAAGMAPGQTKVILGDRHSR